MIVLRTCSFLMCIDAEAVCLCYNYHLLQQTCMHDIVQLNSIRMIICAWEFLHLFNSCGPVGACEQGSVNFSIPTLGVHQLMQHNYILLFTSDIAH